MAVFNLFSVGVSIALAMVISLLLDRTSVLILGPLGGLGLGLAGTFTKNSSPAWGLGSLGLSFGSLAILIWAAADLAQAMEGFNL